MRLSSFIPFIALAGSSISNAATECSNDFATRCGDFASTLAIDNATVWFSEYLTAGTQISFTENAKLGCEPSISISKDVCRVALRVSTSGRSAVTMEAWLPKNWTGRFMNTGNGGLAGCIQYSDVDYGTSLGFAAIGANNGHNGTSGEPFYRNEEIVKDFAFRSVHVSTVIGKAITSHFYGRPHTKSYFLGCSTGGRQGFKSVQDYPEDFDGVVAGAAALDWNNLIYWSGNFLLWSGPPGSETFVPQDKIELVYKEILEQCDHLDGVIDGVTEDPNICHPQLETLLCLPDSNSTQCLTAQQVSTVNLAFSPVYDMNGTLIYPRLQPGPDTLLLLTGFPSPFTPDWYRYVVYSDPEWDPNSLKPVDQPAANEKVPYIRTWKGDLASFRDRGGKILAYHGLMDGLISSENSQRYYEHVSSSMKLSPAALDDFYRYFRISGMGHCSGGNGAWRIGNTKIGSAGLDPDRNVLMAVVRWVEEGVAPDTILGTKFFGDSETEEIDFQRRHCRYPMKNTYTGQGSPKDPVNWTCK